MQDQLKFSEHDYTILKNFASINPNILIKPGSIVQTCSPVQASLVAKAVMSVDFPVEFGIFDMKEFLNCVGLIENAGLQFETDHVSIVGPSSRMEYFYSERDVLTYFDKSVKMPNTSIEFMLTAANLDHLKSAARTLGHQQIVIFRAGTKLMARVDTISAMDVNKAKNTYQMELADIDSEADFEYVINISNLQMLPDDYEVIFASTGKDHYGQFNSKTYDLSYWMGLQRESNYATK